MTIVFVNYSKSPEPKYPTALKEACDSLKWVLEYSNSPSLDPIWVAIVGDSVGGKLVAIVTMLG